MVAAALAGGSLQRKCRCFFRPQFLSAGSSLLVANEPANRMAPPAARKAACKATGTTRKATATACHTPGRVQKAPQVPAGRSGGFGLGLLLEKNSSRRTS